LVAALILPSIAQQRAAARSEACANKLKLIGLALHNYHSAYKQLPQGTGGSTGGEDDRASNAGRLGPLVGITPFIEHQILWESIVNPYVSPKTKEVFPSMGPVPWYDASIYQPWGRSPSVYQCPETGQPKAPEVPPQVVYTLTIPGANIAGVMTSYVACYGDGTLDAGKIVDLKNDDSRIRALAGNRGIFHAGQPRRFRDILDGLSNTMMFSEAVANIQGKAGVSGIAKDVVGLSENPSLCLKAAKDANTKWWPQGRGSRWCDGLLATSGYQAVLPPNSPSCTSDQGIDDAVIAASSRHQGGVYVLMSDGAVGFISDTIDCGDPTIPGVAYGRDGVSRPGRKSPYGLWGALGTRASKEVIEKHVFAPEARFGAPRLRAEKQNLSIWRSTNGHESLQAQFVRVIDKKTIELKDANGILHQVPLNTLSDKDIYRAVEMDLKRQ
jgi:hypothetical protein